MQVIQLDPGYEDVASRLEEARGRHQLSQLLERSKSLYDQDQFEDSIRMLGKALEMDPDNEAAKGLFRAAQKQLEVVHFYEAGLKYHEQQQWQQAIDFLGRVVRQRPDFRDAAARLQVATRQQELDRLYAKGMDAGNAGRWPEAVHYMEQVVAADEQFRDAAQRLDSARRRIRNRLTGMYDKAKEHLAAGRWSAAIELLEQLNSEASDFGDAPQLLRQAYAWKEQTELVAYYEQGISHLMAGHWEQAVQLFEYVKSRSPGFKDVDEQLRRARQRRTRSRMPVPVPIPEPIVEVETVRHGGYPITTIVVGSVGVFICCLAVVAVLAVAGRSRPLAFNWPVPVDTLWGAPTTAPVFQAPVEEIPAVMAMPSVAVTESASVAAVVLSATTAPVLLEVTATPESVRVTATPAPLAISPTASPLAIRPAVVSTSTLTVTRVVTVTSAVSTAGLRVMSVPPAVRFRPTSVVSVGAPVTVGASTTSTLAAAAGNPTPKSKPAKATDTLVALSGQIAFPIYDPGARRFSIYLANMDGSGLRGVVTDASSPSLSPDGARLAYRSWANQDRRIMILDLNTGEQTRLTGFAEDSRPQWSAEGRLVFNSTRESDRRSRIYVVGTWVGAKDEPLRGPQGTIYGDNGSWLGTSRIAYDLCLPGGCGLYVVNADGNGSTKVLDTTDRVSLNGSPDGRRNHLRRQAGWELGHLRDQRRWQRRSASDQ